ncbi:hypothetical protein F2Q69_00010962 [Brassica cretica]|uniref:Uncharacterized protein n=1 Tax=Brassica cretica TaxID=69181 RepID=A0A8S9R770_BRACR|nr:hypothetical protein F2Q69_00010962 [Brassica cretica]
MVTPIETKQETFRSRFEGEHKDGGKGDSEQAKEFRRVLLVFARAGGLTGRYIASGSKPRRVLLVFVVKSLWKLRLRRNKKRYDEDSKENAKEALAIGGVAAGVFLPALLRTVIFSFVFPDIVLIKHFAAMS